MLQTLTAISATLIAALLLSACGETKFYQDPRYIAVHSGNNTNYYRVRVVGRTVLGKSEFRSGWYPADAVDSLFGDVSDEGAVEALKTREDIKASINKYYKNVIEAYLKAAADPDTSEERLRRLLLAQRRVMSVPGDGTPGPEGTLLMEYDPRRNLVVRHADDKLVFILSSDPDEVIGAIVNFAEHQQTSLQVTRLAEVLSQQALNRVVTSEAELDALKSSDALLARRIDQARVTAANDDAARADVMQEVESLLIMVDALR